MNAPQFDGPTEARSALMTRAIPVVEWKTFDHNGIHPACEDDRLAIRWFLPYIPDPPALC